MTNTDPPPPAPPKRRRKFRWIVALACLAGIVTYSFWLPFLVEKLLPPVAPYFGYDLSVDRVARCDLGGVEIEGLRVDNKSATGPLRLLRAEEFGASFAWTLLKGELESLHRIHGKQLRVELLAVAESDAPVASTAPSNWLEPFARLPEIELTDVELFYTSGEQEQRHALDHLTVDNKGQVDLLGTTAERRIAAQATWSGTGFQNLRVEVDGELLLQDSAVELSKAYLGEVAVDAAIPIGGRPQAIQLELNGQGLRWKAYWEDLDLLALRARIPMEFELDLEGNLSLDTEGRLDWADPAMAEVQLQFRGEGLNYLGLEIPSAGGELHTKDGVLRIPSLEVRLTAGNHALIEGAILPLIDLHPEHWLESARAKLSVVVEDSAPLLDAFGPAEEARPKLVKHRIALSAVLDGRTLLVDELGLTSDAGNVQLTSGRIDLGQDHSFAVEAAGQARLRDLSAVGRLFGREDWSGALGGNLILEGTWPQLGGEVELAGTNVTLEGIELGQLQLSLRTAEPGADIEVTGLQIRSPQGDLRGRLRITPGAEPRVRIEELSLTRQDQQLALQAPAEILLGETEGSCPPLVFEGSAGRFECQGSWQGSDFDARLDVMQLNPNFLNSLQDATSIAMAGSDLRLKVQSRAGLLEFQSEGNVRGWIPPQWPEPIDLRWSFVHKEAKLRIRALEATQGDQTLLSLSGECPIEMGEALVFGEDPLDIHVEAHLPLGLLQTGAQGTLKLAGTLAGTWRALSGSIDLAGSQLRLAPEWHPEGLASGNIQGRVLLGDSLRIQNASLQFDDWIDCAINLEGQVPLSLPFWMDSIDDALAASTVESSLEIASLDVEKLRPLLTGLSESFEILREGKLAGDLRVSGALDAPELRGSMSLTQGRVRPGGGLPPIEALSAVLELEQEQVVVREVRGNLGAAPFVIAGDVQLSGAAPTMNLTLKGEDLLLLRNPDARVRANTDLRVSGPLNELLLQGKLELTTGNYSPQLDFLNMRSGPRGSSAKGFQLFTFREPPMRDMAFDIQLTAIEPFAIHNSILNGSIRPQLHLGGRGLVPILTGTVYMEPTRLKLPATQMDIMGGTLRFLEENPFVPQLDIQAQTRQLGYDVRADIAGAYDDPELMLSSTPPLSQEDLFLLVLTGRLPEDPNRTDLRSTANTVAIYLARDALARWFSDDGPLNEDSLVERLEFVLGQDVSKNGSETFEVAIRLSDRMGKPAETKNARHTYVVAERDKYEDYNYGLRWVFRFRR